MSDPKTIRFPEFLESAIQKCAEARGISFSKVVVETCEERYTKHEPTIADRVKVLEEKVNKLEDK
tara:strand:+ start:2720 stop:2914 length:195 start_codon:yes stop_codon:yes gene_type:complete